MNAALGKQGSNPGPVSLLPIEQLQHPAALSQHQLQQYQQMMNVPSHVIESLYGFPTSQPQLQQQQQQPHQYADPLAVYQRLGAMAPQGAGQHTASTGMLSAAHMAALQSQLQSFPGMAVSPGISNNVFPGMTPATPVGAGYVYPFPTLPAGQQTPTDPKAVTFPIAHGQAPSAHSHPHSQHLWNAGLPGVMDFQLGQAMPQAGGAVSWVPMNGGYGAMTPPTATGAAANATSHPQQQQLLDAATAMGQATACTECGCGGRCRS